MGAYLDDSLRDAIGDSDRVKIELGLPPGLL
jgi:hypothetical protein